MASEMVERVARALCAEPDALVCRQTPIPLWLPVGYMYAARATDVCPAWHLKIADAIAAIWAMREPTEEMKVAGADANMAAVWIAKGTEIRSQEDRVFSEAEIGEAYRAMIDAALAKGSQGNER